MTTSSEGEARLAEARLLRMLGEMGSVVVALSGGVDSAYVAWSARQALGDRALAVTGVSPSLSAEQRQMARDVARLCEIEHLEIDTDEMQTPEYVRNEPDRCYYCKNELYGLLAGVANARGAVVVDGTNVDDLDDERPGLRAAAEFGVRSPLIEAGLGKAGIRELAHAAGLPVWDAPASACLASRIPHGTPVTIKRLSQVERAERELRALGFRQVRVRNHDEMARIELAVEELPRALSAEVAAKIIERLRPIGFRRIALDLEGYHSRE
jgi:uncharacterized protein